MLYPEAPTYLICEAELRRSLVDYKEMLLELSNIVDVNLTPH